MEFSEEMSYIKIINRMPLLPTQKGIQRKELSRKKLWKLTKQ